MRLIRSPNAYHISKSLQNRLKMVATASSPTRRVLGDKPTNALMHQRAPAMTKIFALEHEGKDAVMIQKERTPQIGQKRSIEHVDGTEEHAQSLSKSAVSPQLTEPEDAKPTTPVKEDDDKEQTGHLIRRATSEAENDTTEPGTAAGSTGSTAMEGKHNEIEPSPTSSDIKRGPLLTSFHASQEGSLPIEDQFDIQDEASQRTLEIPVSTRSVQLGRIHVTHTSIEPNTTSTRPN